MKYHIWTEGCQMNVADSQRVASALEHLGYSVTPKPEEADVIVLNTCVVRQSAEDKAYGRLNSLRPLKEKNPHLVINLMGCLVGIRNNDALRKRFPFVDVFSPPSDPSPLVAFLTQSEVRAMEESATATRYAYMDGDLVLPEVERGKLVSAHIPVVYGCSHACTYCIIPYRRGIERSRPPEDILAEARALVRQGVKEITLLGQIVDRYGKDNPAYPTLAGLLIRLSEIEGLERIRFLTSHPNWMTDELLDAVASLPKVMPHIEVPAQAGDDTVLENMKRGYTAEQYRELIARIRERIPGVSIATDIIVGFPGETEEQFMNTYRLLEDLRLDVAHLARYSPRPGTVSARRMKDDVPEEEKMRRFRMLEELQERIVGEINARYLGESVPVLFEEKVKQRWKGRTPTNKLVFVESEEDLHGQIREVKITWTGPWSMIGSLKK
ncbi:tRNA (N6-isopentenyl adenosine(37)-C2)-methylthiotransferase MiaB [Anaerolinea thermophila]|uniref:tRNA-2-methylthio-N(6)-dimethylallyladenosine synthase n=1 Tax=Anaerolinea thermophila (strain DSM 14523 / JCM 11388 / NBRC 100420 / UNI-1) TaxID=926569 RepID=E8N259_ANATU|nr:tRNA (N6-isopentenyl adenosine(37)-C2)-methylthiotransferase MiaB [Anaerolinea thermophila]BAJ65006.1 putative tRNA-thiotransferase [Anaerolinea thermophila UNI-1]